MEITKPKGQVAVRFWLLLFCQNERLHGRPLREARYLRQVFFAAGQSPAGSGTVWCVPYTAKK